MSTRKTCVLYRISRRCVGTFIASGSSANHCKILSTVRLSNVKCTKGFCVTAGVRYYSRHVLSEAEYDKIAEETLQHLCEYLEALPDIVPCTNEFDVAYSQGVLTVKLTKQHGTYVLNKQSPNLQIWLSSPLSGPKRYDFVDGQWIYKHDGMELKKLLQQELRQIFNSDKIDLNV